MRLHVAGHYWHYSEPRRIAWEGGEVDGLCIVAPRREIRVCRKLRGRRKAETQLHELAHAANFSSSENWVTNFAAAACDLCYLAGAGLCRDGDMVAGAAIIRQVLFHSLRLARGDIEDDELVQDWADELTRAVGRLRWAAFTN